MSETYLTFLAYLIGMLIIGIYTYRLTNTLSDYVLGGRKLNSWVAALSAQASDMSGWLLLGLPGAAYASGMGMWSIWIAIGLATGTMINWQYVAKRLRRYTEIAGDAITLSEYFANRFKDRSQLLRVISAVFILVFFLFYTASGLVAGGKLFEATFGIDYSTALIIGALVIVGYTFLGGFLAVSLTDFVQGTLMFIALLVAPVVAISYVGGVDALFTKIGAANPDLLDVAADVNFVDGVWESVGTLSVVGIISALAWGLGYFGQPHILARFMAIRSDRDIPAARLISVIWVVITLYGAIIVGFVGIAMFSGDQALADPETVFLVMVQTIFSPWVAGILLAAVLAAIMSTIDSQLLVSSSALTEDFYRTFFRRNATEKELVWMGRLAVLVIALIALMLAWDKDNTVLGLVAYAWAGFGAAFGPAVLFSLFWKRMTGGGAMAGIISGGLTVILWEYTPFELYSIVPGFIISSIMIVLVSLVDQEPSQEIQDEFEQVKRPLQQR
ncbi:sodium/proline symporter [Caldalkalibacillus thermarum TA2.A1]|uniref:Sodium/proline symporter n=1 Tax=Caldalkalibacillus thermarum (strain TA2.A1) TaxID=986075 RepID=F5LAW5_CALTT|nr:sodium/proline symporter PutP [Caldalkalibacillus thermarum]EGL81504.1 sodium/proline symporter [Caldalkalibacillus thermarum TA2.A1]QZT33806.1 sodium/proline symporter PutP [Caldalkalibacillus thermarum TA2.A1]